MNNRPDAKDQIVNDASSHLNETLQSSPDTNMPKDESVLLHKDNTIQTDHVRSRSSTASGDNNESQNNVARADTQLHRKLAMRRIAAKLDGEDSDIDDVGPGRRKRFAAIGPVIETPAAQFVNDLPDYKQDAQSTSLRNEQSERQRHRSASKSEQNPDQFDQMRKLFIGGLDYKTTEETLKAHFDKFGHVTDCVVMREPQSRRSRGFGFVIFASSEMVDQAQVARPHEIDGREVQTKRAIPKEESGRPDALATVKKIYLGGLSDAVGERELREYFEEFGKIVDITIAVHKDTGRRRGFAFVEFDDYDPVDKIVWISKYFNLVLKIHKIKEERIEARKAIPKVEMDARRQIGPYAAMAGPFMAMGAITGANAMVSPIEELSHLSRVFSRNRLAAQGYLAAPFQGSTGPLDGYPSPYQLVTPYYNTNWLVHSNHTASQMNSRGCSQNRSGARAHGLYMEAPPMWPGYGPFLPALAPNELRSIRSSTMSHHRDNQPYSNGSPAQHRRG